MSLLARAVVADTIDPAGAGHGVPRWPCVRGMTFTIRDAPLVMSPAWTGHTKS
jgi:hypothetical protein